MAPRQLFASPAYVERRGAPRSIKSLADHDCVIFGPRAERATWTLHSGKREQRIAVGGRIAVNEARMAARCAVAGLGIALLPRTVCAGPLAAGELVQVLPRVHGGDTTMWIVYPDRRLPAAARALADVLVEELSSTDRWTR